MHNLLVFTGPRILIRSNLSTIIVAYVPMSKAEEFEAKYHSRNEEILLPILLKFLADVFACGCHVKPASFFFKMKRFSSRLMR